MDSKEAEKFLERAHDLLELAVTIRSDQHRELLIESAQKFIELAMRGFGIAPGERTKTNR